MNKSVQQIVYNKECCSCGICVGVCPKLAITLEMDNGIPTPKVDFNKCVNCGLCSSVCPGKSGIEEYIKVAPSEITEYCSGTFSQVEICRTNNVELLSKTTSGGVISSILSTLLDDKEKYGYEKAFVVKSNNFSNIAETCACAYADEIAGSEKSRYVSVSQKNTVQYILSQKDEKIIITGTSCAIQGILNVIEHFNLNRENYLLIGVFCDKLMTYHVWDYFSKFGHASTELRELFFRTKEQNGWPGDVKLVFDGETLYLGKMYRSQVKDFFCHPRCLYCVDKLNRYADISVGDNYSGEYVDPMGSSCVIVRTDIGMRAYNSIRAMCKVNKTNINKVIISQEINKKVENLYFAKHIFAKEKVPGVKLSIKYYYKRIKIFIGNRFHTNHKIINFFVKIDKFMKL